jgi:hypothetical protein
MRSFAGNPAATDTSGQTVSGRGATGGNAVGLFGNGGSGGSGGQAAAATPTTGILAAGADEVSAAVAAVFDAHAQGDQAPSTQAAAFHQQFAQALNAGAGAYASAEAANAAATPNLWQVLQQQLLGAINTPTEALLGRPLIGDGTNAAPGSGKNGGDGGLVFGNGGAGGGAFAGGKVGQGGNGGLLLGVPGTNGLQGP